MSPNDIEERKADHLDLCLDEDVEFTRKSTLLEEVELIHDALPEMNFDQVDLSTMFLGRQLKAPLLIPRRFAITVPETAGLATT